MVYSIIILQGSPGIVLVIPITGYLVMGLQIPLSHLDPVQQPDDGSALVPTSGVIALVLYERTSRHHRCCVGNQVLFEGLAIDPHRVIMTQPYVESLVPI